MLYRLQIPFLLCCWIGLSTNAHACSVPVFRYAVEHWPPDVYEALVLHRGKLSETDKAVTDHLLGNGRYIFGFLPFARTMKQSARCHAPDRSRPWTGFKPLIVASLPSIQFPD